MNIIGPDALIFGVEDLDGCARYLEDFGLQPAADASGALTFEALDGTAVVLRHAADASLPPVLGPGPAATLRETVYGVVDAAALEAIAAELERDRAVGRSADGALHCVDDSGFALAFQITRRRPLVAAPVLCNAPGSPAQRPVNMVGSQPDAVILPRTLSHVVYLVPDAARAEAFYRDRLGFRVTDRFDGVGPFLRPAGSQDHHALFLIETPIKLLGLEHFAFHLGSGADVMQAGTRFVSKAINPSRGPGRHIFGSNWFWYFNSPLGCKMEYDADMDLHDDSWAPRTVPMGADASQLFLFESCPNGHQAARPGRIGALMGSPIMLCRLDALAPGSARGFDPSGAGWDSVIAVRLLNMRDDDAPVRLYRNDCPHEHRPLGWRKDAFLAADGRHLMCFAHGARFEIDGGICVEGPCAGAALQTLACSIDGGTVRLASEP